MSWMLLADLFFLIGVVVAGGLLLGGAWLCMDSVARESLAAAPPEDVAPAAVQALSEEDASEHTVAGLAAPGLVVLGFLLAVAGSGPVLAAGPLDRGLEAYEQARYADAVAQFRLAADGGDGRAQEILGFMYLHGPSLYGAAVQSDRAQAVHWFRRAAQGGREVSRHMLCVLEGRPAQTVVARASCGRPDGALGAPGPDGMARAAAFQGAGR